MAFIVLAYVVMALSGQHRFRVMALYSYGIYSDGLCSYGSLGATPSRVMAPYSYGLYSYGSLGATPSPSAVAFLAFLPEN